MPLDEPVTSTLLPFIRHHSTWANRRPRCCGGRTMAAMVPLPRLLFSLTLPIAAAGLAAVLSPRDGKTHVPPKPTYAEQVAPLLNKSCVPCHRPGEVAPFPLIGY